MGIDVSLGQQIEHLVCEDCKKKIAEATSKVTKLQLLRPNKLAKKFFGLLCPACTGAVKRHYQK